jgi:hypothetical protein
LMMSSEYSTNIHQSLPPFVFRSHSSCLCLRVIADFSP